MNMKKISKFLAAVGVASMITGLGCAEASTIVYEANVTNGNNIYGEREECTFCGGTLKLNFRYGSLSVITTPSAQTNGTTAYADIPNGKSFLFSYILDNETGDVSVAVNGEVEATGACTSLIGKSIDTSWYTKYSRVGPTLKNAGIKNIAPQSVSVSACDTYSVKLNFVRPIQYAEISNLKLVDASGKELKIVDYTKDCYSVTLKTADEMTKNALYTVAGSQIPDIYGTSTDISVTFRPTASGSKVEGNDITPSKDVKRAWGFERRIDWREEVNLTGDHGWSIYNTLIGTDSSDDFYQRIYAMKLSKEHKKEGEYSLKWDNHPFYSTVATDIAEKDWTGANTFNMWMYSEKATGETVNILVYSDNPNTPWEDGYLYPVKVDWVGEKEFNIPLNEFERFENPTGFDNVSKIYFTTKIYNGAPSPDTVLYLDDISVTYDEAYPITPTVKSRVTPENIHRGMLFDYSAINHNGTEVVVDKQTPYQYEAYKKTERALYGYNPKYIPGVASFDKDGRVYLRPDGTHIEYLDDNGMWQVVDLDSYVKQYKRVWDGGAIDESVIRFDNDGWAYVLVTTESGSVLLWSSDNMQTWKQHEFGVEDFNARFERIEGNNQDAMNNPPLILLHPQQSYTNQEGKVVIPTKTASGGLNFRTIKYADNCIPVQAHTGDGNFIISDGDYAYVSYAIYDYDKLTNPIEVIPQDHPAVSMKYNRDGTELYYKNGCPTFVRKINLTTGELSAPVFVGFGGVENDDHNWSGISIDSKGYLHVIMNGHHDPVCYTKSVRPYDISEWTDIELLGTYNSYGAMIIDKHDTIHICTRDASRGYRFDTSVMTKTTNGSWEKNYIIKRKSPYYEVARQRMTYNPVADEFYMHYFSQSSYFEVFEDEYESILFTWPNEERNMLTSTLNGNYNVTPHGTDRMPQKTKCYWEFDDAGNGREGVLIKSSDGKVFNMVKTEDCR